MSAVASRVALLLIVVACPCLVMVPMVRADDLERAAPSQNEVNAIIDVLNAAKAGISPPCFAAIDEMHTTEHQLNELDGNLEEGGEAPQALASQANEVGVARDVLANDIDTAASTCRPEAERTCAASDSPDCVKLLAATKAAEPSH